MLDTMTFSHNGHAGKDAVPSDTPSMSLVSLLSTGAGSVAGSKRSAAKANLDVIQTPNSSVVKKPRRRWRKPAGKPKRPLSAYNLYFKAERDRMLREEGSVEIGFRDMAKLIASKWNKLPQKDRSIYEGPAKEERTKYFTQLAEWKKEQQKKQKEEVFDRQMESLYDAFSGCTDNADNDEPLPISSVPCPVTSASIPTRDSVAKLQPRSLADSLQMASDLSDDTLKLAVEESTSLDSFDLFGSKMNDDDDGAMKRILESCDVLNSSIDGEFVDFMSNLDWAANPVDVPSYDGFPL